jgi:hypothetical protein
MDRSPLLRAIIKQTRRETLDGLHSLLHWAHGQERQDVETAITYVERWDTEAGA